MLADGIVHRRRPTAITPSYFLDLHLYWGDIVNLIGVHYMHLPNFATRFRIVVVDMCWIGHGDVLPHGVPVGARISLFFVHA